MSLQSHLEELERRHAILEEQIAQTQLRPSADMIEVKALKQQKLRLKDEIVRLRETLEPTPKV